MAHWCEFHGVRMAPYETKNCSDSTAGTPRDHQHPLNPELQLWLPILLRGVRGMRFGADNAGPTPPRAGCDYAKKAQGELPSLKDYEEAKASGKILVIKHEADVPVNSNAPAEK